MNIPEAIKDVQLEYIKSIKKFGDFFSNHDGYAILLEEVDELWDEIKKRPEQTNNSFIYKEAKHVAAMALKMMLFVGNK